MAQVPAPVLRGNDSDDHPSRWLTQVRRRMETSAAELGAVAKVFDVPQLLRDTKPEAYVPQHFAIGPYHYQRPELKDMERYKLAAAKHAEERFKLDDLVNRFVGEQQRIRNIYHRYLELDGQTLAWMMAIDTCFLLDFMDNWMSMRERTDTDIVSPMDNWINIIVRDAMMLQNQIPLFLFAGTLELRHGSDDATADAAMRAILNRFIRDVSPIKTTALGVAGDVARNAHLLDLLYNFLVQPFYSSVRELEAPDEEVISMEELEEEVPDYDKVKQAYKQVSSLDIAPVRFIKRNLSALWSLQERVMSKVPLLAALMAMLGKLLASTDLGTRIKDVDMGTISNSPLMQEIKMLVNPAQTKISSVSSVVYRGTKTSHFLCHGRTVEF